MLTSLGTIPTLLLLLTTLTPSVTASATLKSEVYQLPDYPYLTTCQKRCTAGEPSNQADLISIFYLSNCDTKACFCPAQNEPQIGQQAQRCLETEGSGACATVKEYNGLMAFVGKYCGFNYAPATTGLLFPPSGGAATTTPGVTASCWNKYGYPVQTAGCSSTSTFLPPISSLSLLYEKIGVVGLIHFSDHGDSDVESVLDSYYFYRQRSGIRPASHEREERVQHWEDYWPLGVGPLCE